MVVAFTVSLCAAPAAIAAPPNQPTLDNASVQENKPVGTVVGTLSTTDPDAGETFTYLLVGGTGDTDNGKFKIVGDKLTTRQVLDYETQQSASVRVRVEDSHGERNRSVFAIQITNDASDDPSTNQKPTDLSLSNQTVAENQAAGTDVGTLTATDPNAGDTFTYKKAEPNASGGADNPKFQVVGDKLQTKQPLDFEAGSTLSVRLQVTDSGGLVFKKNFTITLTDSNDPPTDISLSNGSVAENQPSGTTVGTINVTDQNAGDTQTLTLVSGTGDTDNASFTIDGSTLETNAVFDFETKNQYSIRIQTDDGTGNTFQKAFVISVTDVADTNRAPTDISLSNLSVAENEPSGTTVGTASTTDPDAGDIHTYTLVSGTGDTDNGSFTIDGSTLKTNAVYDYETKNQYSIRIQTDDGNGHTFQKQFTITITDVLENSAPTDIVLSNASVGRKPAGGDERRQPERR